MSENHVDDPNEDVAKAIRLADSYREHDMSDYEYLLLWLELDPVAVVNARRYAQLLMAEEAKDSEFLAELVRKHEEKEAGKADTAH
jgi:hypothetical protein